MGNLEAVSGAAAASVAQTVVRAIAHELLTAAHAGAELLALRSLKALQGRIGPLSSPIELRDALAFVVI